jgi:hypothetical protein
MTEAETNRILDASLPDQVFQMRDGWYCRVAGRVYGEWACREYAVAGMQVEQHRALSR